MPSSQKDRDSPPPAAALAASTAPNQTSVEAITKQFVKSLTITMLIELLTFGSNLTCVSFTPWLHGCNLYNGQTYLKENYTTDSVGELSGSENIIEIKEMTEKCTNKDSLSEAHCSAEVANATSEEYVTMQCFCTNHYDTLTLWDSALVSHDETANMSVAWPVRGLICVAVVLKFLVTFEYFLCLVSEKMRNSATNYIVKFCSSWLSGAFLLGSTMHVCFSDYYSMCDKFGIGFWAMVVSFIMSVPSMFGVLMAAGYYVHLKTLQLDLKNQ